MVRFMMTHDMPPRGYYLAHEVGFLAGVSGDRIGQWARRGYIKSSDDETVPRVYAYQDIVEAMVVHQLLEENVTHGAIKNLLRDLGNKYGQWPLTHADLWVDDSADRKDRVYFKEHGQTWTKGQQGVLREIVKLREIHKYLERGGWVVRDNPEIQHIQVHPDRMSGTPVIRGKRVEATLAGELAITASGRRTLQAEYDLTPDEIEDARKWYLAVMRVAA